MKDGRAASAVCPPRAEHSALARATLFRREEEEVQYLGIDWGTRRAAWCALSTGGELTEGTISADEDGLARLVARLGPDVQGCIEMMSGAVWVRDRLADCGWMIEIADARKVEAIAPLACKTDRVDARVLADLARRDLVPGVWVPPLDDRAIRERLRTDPVPRGQRVVLYFYPAALTPGRAVTFHLVRHASPQETAMLPSAVSLQSISSGSSASRGPAVAGSAP